MPLAEGHDHTPKAKRMAERINDSGKSKYGERVEEIAWRVVHSELPRDEREKKA